MVAQGVANPPTGLDSGAQVRILHLPPHLKEVIMSIGTTLQVVGWILIIHSILEGLV